MECSENRWCTRTPGYMPCRLRRRVIATLLPRMTLYRYAVNNEVAKGKDHHLVSRMATNFISRSAQDYDPPSQNFIAKRESPHQRPLGVFIYHHVIVQTDHPSLSMTDTWPFPIP